MHKRYENSTKIINRKIDNLYTHTEPTDLQNAVGKVATSLRNYLHQWIDNKEVSNQLAFNTLANYTDTVANTATAMGFGKTVNINEWKQTVTNEFLRNAKLTYKV